MRPAYKPNEYGRFTNDEMIALLEGLDPNGDSAAFIRLLAAWVEKELKVINSQPLSHKNIGHESALELIAAMMTNGFWTPSLVERI